MLMDVVPMTLPVVPRTVRERAAIRDLCDVTLIKRIRGLPVVYADMQKFVGERRMSSEQLKRKILNQHEMR